MQVSRYLSLILLAVALDSCSERYFDSKTEGEKLLRRDAEWADLATAGKDVEKVVSYWTEDAVLIFPGQPVLEGKAAIRAYVTARSEEHTSELQSPDHLVCRLLLEKK